MNNMARTVFVALLCAMSFWSTNAFAAIAWSDFEVDADGWVGWACENPGLCVVSVVPLPVQYLAAGGNPGGYIRTQDPSGDTAARLEPPAKFSSNYAVGQTLKFDAIAEDNGGGGVFDSAVAPLVAIEGTGGTLVYFTTDLPTPLNVWKHYDVPLSETIDWQIFDGAILRPLLPGEFAAVFGSMTRLTIIGEWLSDVPELDTGGLDNVHLVPLPAALSLLLPALFGLGFAARRQPH